MFGKTTDANRRLWFVRILAAIALVILAAPQKAHALSCSATVTDVDFGSPNLLSAGNTDTLATVTITCTAIPFLQVVKMCPSIDDGTGGWSGLLRLMKGPGNATLTYQLYQDASRTTPWGALTNPQLGTVPAIILSNISGTATATQTIYARLFGNQATSPPGSYSSSFAGAEAAFTYSPFLLTASSSCVGFVGTRVVYPEFDVIAAPAAGCNLTTANLTFPNTGVLNSSVSGQTTLGVGCTSQTPYSISLDNGGKGTSPTARRMVSAASDAVIYGLYRDSARTLAWGSAASGLGTSSVGTGTQQAFTVYGLVSAQTTPKPGTYTDRIVVTLTY